MPSPDSGIGVPPMGSCRRGAAALISLCFATSCATTSPTARLEAPNPQAPPVNQLSVSGNACGPAALLYSFSAGDDSWQRAWQAIPGDNDRKRITYVIRRYALQPSLHLREHPRWSRRGGIGAADLADMANEMTRGHYLPGVGNKALVTAAGKQTALLDRLHRDLATSLKRGLPPILAIKRMSRPGNGGPSSWSIVAGHYVVVTSIPTRLPRAAASFDFDYVDPYGGHRRRGMIRIPGDTTAPWLEADCPDTPVGRVISGHSSHLAAASVIGRF